LAPPSLFPYTTLFRSDRRAGPVGLVEAVEEEPLRAVHGGSARDRRQVAVPAAVARDIDRGGREPVRLERLVDRLGALREVALVRSEEHTSELQSRVDL